MKKIAFIIFILMNCCKLILQASNSISLETDPPCYKSGKPLTLLLRLPAEATEKASAYTLQIRLIENNTPVEQIITGEKIAELISKNRSSPDSADVPDEYAQGGVTISVPLYIKPETSGDVIIESSLVHSGRTIEIIRHLVNDESACLGPSKKPEAKKQNGIITYKTAARKDYRERLIYGEIIVEATEWPEFQLILKAERATGGGGERAYLKIKESGRFGYRLGNLYPGEYIFETENIETHSTPVRVTFEAEELSKKIDIEISRIIPVNLRVYSFDISNLTHGSDGSCTYQLKAYVCRFDNSPITNLKFNWQCGGIFYYNTLAPEKNHCIPLTPPPITLKENEQINLELEVNPEIRISPPDEPIAPRLVESAYEDNRASITLTGKK